MNQNDIKLAFIEALREYNAFQIPATVAPTPQNPKKGMEFSKWLMIFAALLCGGTWVVAAVSWLLWREFPYELVQYTGWFFGAVIAYMVKSGYENKPKIQRGGGGDR